MRAYMKKIGIALLALLGLCACVWRLWPHSFEDIISADADTITSVACTVSIAGIDDGSALFIDTYQLQALTEDGAELDAVMDILSQTQYLQSFQNLLPWAITSVSSEGGTKSASIVLTWGGTERDACFLTVQNGGKVAVDLGESDSLLVYHAADRSLLDKLVRYVQDNGTKAES